MKRTYIAGLLGAVIVAAGLIPFTDSSANACAKHRRHVSHARSHRTISQRVVERRYLVERPVVQTRYIDRPVVQTRYIDRPVVVAQPVYGRRTVLRRVIETPVVVRKRERGIIPKIYSLIFGG
jgi:hypothetical protein